MCSLLVSVVSNLYAVNLRLWDDNDLKMQYIVSVGKLWETCQIFFLIQWGQGLADFLGHLHPTCKGELNSKKSKLQYCLNSVFVEKIFIPICILFLPKVEFVLCGNPCKFCLFLFIFLLFNARRQRAGNAKKCKIKYKC